MLPQAPISDDQLLQLLLNDEEQGLRTLFRHHGGRVLNYLERRFGKTLHFDQLEQALSDAALKLARSFDASRGKSVGGWLLYLADRESINILRKEARAKRDQVALGDMDFTTNECPEQPLLQTEFKLAVENAMTRLSILEREVIVADMDEGKPVNAERLANRLNTATSAVYAARARARRKLSKALPGNERRGTPG